VAEVTAPAGHSVTEVLAAHAAALDLGALPARVRTTAGLLVLDTVGCTLGALTLEDGRRLAATVTAFGEAGPVTLWGQPGTAGPAAAAFVHGNLANFLDADETFRNFSHFCAGVVPAVLAAAEERDATGAQVVVATVAGYEVAARLAHRPPSRKWGSHGCNGGSPSVVMTGLACAASSALCLDASPFQSSLRRKHLTSEDRRAGALVVTTCKKLTSCVNATLCKACDPGYRRPIGSSLSKLRRVA